MERDAGFGERSRSPGECACRSRREALAAFATMKCTLKSGCEMRADVEVQVLGDVDGNLVHLYERDCTVQRRNQSGGTRARTIPR